MAAKLVFENQTIREIVHISIGSDTFRVRLSNAYGRQTVEIGSVHIASRAKASGIVAGSDRILTSVEGPPFRYRPTLSSSAIR